MSDVESGEGTPTPTPQSFLRPPWQPGQSGNPAGRPKGSRNKLGEDFIADLADHWQKNGAAALDGCLAESPAAYCRVIAAIVPKELHIKNDAFDGLNDDEIAALVSIARTALVAHQGGREATGSQAH